MITRELAWDTHKEACDFLSEHGVACFANPNAADEDKVLLCKQAAPVLAQCVEQLFRRVQIKGAV